MGQTECAENTTFSASGKVNSACKSNPIQIPLANLLVVVEAFFDNNPNKDSTLLGCWDEA